MGHEIIAVRPGSVADRHGLKPGDRIEKINGETLIDDIDYQALTAKAKVRLTVQGEDGVERDVTIIKSPSASLGLKMGQSLSLKPRTCKNKCVFCFIDQMPPHMRDTLYVKDDDWRLSLMMGNFVTLTNVDDDEFERIIRRKASPLYISVHATNPEVRVSMMRNPNAGKITERLKKLAEAGIQFHCQIVLCPGLNDGKVLDDTLGTLLSLRPAARSAALVPVGLTKYRENLTKLTPYDQTGALQVIGQAQKWQNECLSKYGTRFVFPSDEFYCVAGLPIPEEETYEGYPQIENGVGLLRKFEESLRERSKEGQSEKAADRKVLLVCGTSVRDTMQRWVDTYAPQNARVQVQAIRNYFFGETVTVSGLLTGHDIYEQIKDTDAVEILLCDSMLRAEGDLFLDDMSIVSFREMLAPRVVRVIPNTGRDLYEALLGQDA